MTCDVGPLLGSSDLGYRSIEVLSMASGLLYDDSLKNGWLFYKSGKFGSRTLATGCRYCKAKENDWGMRRNSCVPSKINSMRKPSNWMGSPYVTVFCVCALGMCTGLWSVNGILGNRLFLHIFLEVMVFMKRLHLWSLRRFMISLWYSSVVYLVLSMNPLWA